MVRRCSLKLFTISLLFAGVLIALPQPAAAQAITVDDFRGMSEPEVRSLLISLIAELQEKLLIAQRKQYEHVYQEDTNIIHGNSYVVATDDVTLYAQPGGDRSAGRQSEDDGGEVSGGPRLINGEVWWKVAFTDEGEGWVKERYLERIPSVLISVDEDNDGVPDRSARLLGDYRADRIILFPLTDRVVPVYIEEDMDMIGSHEEAYVSGQVDQTINGPVSVLQTDIYADLDLVKGEDRSVPIAWQALNVPMNSKVEVQVEALRLVDNPISGGTWEGRMVVGDSVSRYFWNIEGAGRIGAGDYRSQVRVKECIYGACTVVAESPYRYFSIRNPE